jgi:hypothetical protein
VLVGEPGVTGQLQTGGVDNAMMTTELQARRGPATTILDLRSGADEYAQTLYEDGLDPYATRPEEEIKSDEYVKMPRRRTDSDTKPLL